MINLRMVAPGTDAYRLTEEALQLARGVTEHGNCPIQMQLPEPILTCHHRVGNTYKQNINFSIVKRMVHIFHNTQINNMATLVVLNASEQ